MSKSMEKRLRVQVPRIAELEAEVERLRAYLPLARAAAAIDGWNWWVLEDPTARRHCAGLVRAYGALTPEQRRALMEGE